MLSKFWGFGPQDWDLGLKVRLLASKLVFGPQGWDLGFKAKRLGFGPQSGIWTSRLRFGPQDWVLGKIRQKLAEFGRNWLKLTDFGRI